MLPVPLMPLLCACNHHNNINGNRAHWENVQKMRKMKSNMQNATDFYNETDSLYLMMKVNQRFTFKVFPLF